MNWMGGARNRAHEQRISNQKNPVYRFHHNRRGNNAAAAAEELQQPPVRKTYNYGQHLQNKRPCPLLNFIKESLPSCGSAFALQLSHQMELDSITKSYTRRAGAGDASSGTSSSTTITPGGSLSADSSNVHVHVHGHFDVQGDQELDEDDELCLQSLHNYEEELGSVSMSNRNHSHTEDQSVPNSPESGSSDASSVQSAGSKSNYFNHNLSQSSVSGSGSCGKISRSSSTSRSYRTPMSMSASAANEAYFPSGCHNNATNTNGTAAASSSSFDRDRNRRLNLNNNCLNSQPSHNSQESSRSFIRSNDGEDYERPPFRSSPNSQFGGRPRSRSRQSLALSNVYSQAEADFRELRSQPRTPMSMFTRPTPTSVAVMAEAQAHSSQIMNSQYPYSMLDHPGAGLGLGLGRSQQNRSFQEFVPMSMPTPQVIPMSPIRSRNESLLSGSTMHSALSALDVCAFDFDQIMTDELAGDDGERDNRPSSHNRASSGFETHYHYPELLSPAPAPNTNHHFHFRLSSDIYERDEDEAAEPPSVPWLSQGNYFPLRTQTPERSQSQAGIAERFEFGESQ